MHGVDFAVLLCLDEDELALGQYFSAWFRLSSTSLLWSFSYLLIRLKRIYNF
jgi:hypothetical protein